MPNTDNTLIDKLTSQFFDLFTNTDNRTPDVQKIKELFLPEGIIINNTGEQPEVYDLEGFIQPREKVLTDGTLNNFCENETSHRTEIHENIAYRFCEYEKSGEYNGVHIYGKGKKMMQFIKKDETWFLTSVVWTDE